ncbi:MAG: N-acetyl-gamma-glutamyl-phosphate reductase [Polyangiaceae bacterium]|nr:N-acetyl-gamma-glutamyl-phosphate reductase [Polyangiaceae bacterium]
MTQSPTRRFRAAILGASGFAGAELLRRLLRHPHVEVVRACAADHLGEPVWSAHPHLEGQTSLRFEATVPERAADDVDVVLMGLPHSVSVEVVRAAATRDVRLLDLSGAFRLRDLDAYRRHYGEHPAPELVESFVYGLPELNRDRLRGARRVASPGCFATTIELGLLPLARAGLLEGAIEVVGITGSSGSGVTASAATHHPVRAGNLRTYRPLDHQHSPEIVETLQAAGARHPRLSFVPVSAPLVRGIFATAFARVPASTTEAQLAEAYRESFDDEPFVRVPALRLPEVVAVTGSNHAEVGWLLGPVEGDTRLVTAFSVTDNLMKGGAGQAIQNLNLMLELDERTTLEDPGGYP